MKTNNKIRIKRLEKLLIHLTESETQSISTSKGVNNFYICIAYLDMFGRDFVKDYPEVILFSEEGNTRGAFLTCSGYSDIKKRIIKIFILNFLIEYIK